MQNQALKALVAVASLAACAVANADYFTFQYSDSMSNVAKGTLDAVSNGDGSFTAISGSVDITNGPLTGTYALGLNPSAPAAFNNGNFIYDNQLFPTSDPSIDVDGLYFASADNSTQVNIWGNGTGSQYTLQSWTASNGDSSDVASGNFSLQAVPEPAPSFALAAGGLVMFLRRRKNG